MDETHDPDVRGWSPLAALPLNPAYASARMFMYLATGRRAEAEDPDGHDDWRRRIRPVYFLQGLPAIFGALFFITAAFAASLSTRHREHDFIIAMNKALGEKAFDVAAVCGSRLLRYDPTGELYRYQYGRALEGLGKVDAARQIIAALAPADRVGFGPAHLWVAADLMAGDHAAPSRRRTIEAHLLRFRDDDQLSAQADALLARLYVAERMFDLILKDERLRRAAEAEPELKLELLDVRAARGEREAIRYDVRTLLSHFERLLALDPDSVALRIRTARCRILLDDYAGALAVLRQGVVLRPDGPFGDALVQTAAAYAEQLQRDPRASAASRRTALQEAYEIQTQYGRPTRDEQLRRARLLRALDRPEEARKIYEQLSSESPAVRGELAEWLTVAGQRAEALEEWEQLLADVARRGAPAADSTSPADVAVQRAAARAETELGRFADAERRLLSLDERARRDPEVKRTLLRLYLSWWDSYGVLNADEAPEPAQMHLDLLRKGLKIEPMNQELLYRFLMLARRRDAVAAEVRKMLEELIVKGGVSAEVYLLLGTDALERDDRSAAGAYLAQAFHLNPTSAATLNNLAWTLLQSDASHWTSALNLAEAAVRHDPLHPKFRDTRFRLYAKLERWQDAVRDLEYCAEAMGDDSGFHAAAAEVYEKLNLQDLAARHRRLAKELADSPAK